MDVIDGNEPTIPTMIQEKINTTMVRNAVAKCELVCSIPHFASTDVSPAKNADPNANRIHIKKAPLYILL